MTSARRIGVETSATRSALLDAAERLMRDEGYAAVTSRRVASEAGLKPQLVHYYFRTMDDLFLALIRRGAEANRERLVAALETDRPWRALWELSTDTRGAVLHLEFTALANHRKVIKAEIARYAEEFRTIQVEALTRHLSARRIDPKILPIVAAVLTAGTSQVLVIEETLGITAGHGETLALVEECLRLFEETGDGGEQILPILK